jgi:S-adenosylmethionine:tRNA ribosyltransferase-isomerase
VVLVSDFDYDLPEDLIAQTPLADRSASRMLLVDRAKGRWEDRTFTDFPGYLNSGDRLVVNNTKVLPARLFGRREGVHATTSRQQPTGLIEVLLLKQVASAPLRWEALVRPGRKLRSGEKIHFAGGLDATIVGRGERGLRLLEFEKTASFLETLERIGHTPLPPYIKRSDETADRERYQTVYASRMGSVAAPTAGLHFTPALVASCAARGIPMTEVTLHVGYGTFQPVRVERVEDHHVEPERYEIGAAAAAAINQALDDGRRIVAVGTTTTRALESAVAGPVGRVAAGAGSAELFISPGHRFRVVSGLLTNLHLPRSSLLILVSAFAGRELVIEAYRAAVAGRYRFYSYGDAMLIL